MSRNFTPEQQLVDQLLLNDTSAFEELYHRYCFSLYNYCFSKLHSAADAKKVVRDIFISLWERRQQLPVDFSLSAYLYTEVRKSVLVCINNKLIEGQDTENIEQVIIPGFAIQQLVKQRQPANRHSYHTIAAVSRVAIQQKKEHVWQHYLQGFNLKGLRYALQKVTHLF